MYRTVLVTAPSLASTGVEVLNDAGCAIRYVANYADVEGLRRILRTEPVEAVISRTMSLTEEMIASCPTLRVISKHGTGTSNIDMPGATSLGIAVFSTPGANARSVAEFTIGMMIAAMRRIARFDRSVRAGEWIRSGDGSQLAGRTLGLVGFGRIARQVAGVARALGMQVVAFDPVIDPGLAAIEGVCLRDSLEDVLGESDVISLHCPAQRGAPPILDARRIALLRPGAVIVNTARGELIDETALAAALVQGHVSAAALDTFAQEPVADGPLRRHPAVVLTPHVGGSTREALQEMAAQAARNVVGYLDALVAGRPLSAELAALCLNSTVLEVRKTQVRGAVV